MHKVQQGRSSNMVSISHLRFATLLKLSLQNTTEFLGGLSVPAATTFLYTVLGAVGAGAGGSGHSPSTSDQLGQSPLGGCFWTLLPSVLLPGPAYPLLPARSSIQPGSAAWTYSGHQDI